MLFSIQSAQGKKGVLMAETTQQFVTPNAWTRSGGGILTRYYTNPPIFAGAAFDLPGWPANVVFQRRED
jgi:hypothetical protein